MQLRKTYQNVKPELLHDEIKDLTLKQGVVILEAKLETYVSPGNTSSFISRGTLSFEVPGKLGKSAKECLRVHVVGSARGETKVTFDIDEELFPPEKLKALLNDLDFVFQPYEVETV